MDRHAGDQPAIGCLAEHDLVTIDAHAQVAAPQKHALVLPIEKTKEFEENYARWELAESQKSTKVRAPAPAKKKKNTGT